MYPLVVGINKCLLNFSPLVLSDLSNYLYCVDVAVITVTIITCICWSQKVVVSSG
jgi:hypothetical protein